MADRGRASPRFLDSRARATTFEQLVDEILCFREVHANVPHDVGLHGVCKRESKRDAL
jgi:hypothetical protein